MPVCSKCSKEKRHEDFFLRDKKTGRYHAQCKACYKEHRQTYYANHYLKYKDSYLLRARTRRERLRTIFRANMLEFMSGKGCLDCGENDIRVLELDHISPENKSFSVSQAVKLGYSWDEVLVEIEKCQILCANCHKRRTAQQYQWYKAI